MVDLACLENKCAFTRTGGSNPPLSAKIKYDHLVVFYLAWGSEPPGFAAGKTTAGFGEAKKGSESLLSTLFERRRSLATDIPRGKITAGYRFAPPPPRNVKVNFYIASFNPTGVAKKGSESSLSTLFEQRRPFMADLSRVKTTAEFK